MQKGKGTPKIIFGFAHLPVNRYMGIAMTATKLIDGADSPIESEKIFVVHLRQFC